MNANLNYKSKKVGFLIFYCVLLELVSHKERSHRLTILIMEHNLLFSIHSSCWMQKAKSGKNVGAIECMF